MVHRAAGEMFKKEKLKPKAFVAWIQEALTDARAAEMITVSDQLN